VKWAKPGRVRPGALSLGLSTLAASLVTSPARADVSSWFSLAPGVSVIDQTAVSQGTATPSGVVPSGLLDLDSGLGTHPGRPVVFGAIFHFAAQWAVGADLGGAMRFCSGSYARGDWGFGVDLGADYRVATFGGAAPFARVFVGAPYGLVLQLSGSYREGDVGTLSLSLGLDFARLSTHRSYWTEVLPSPLVSPDAPVQPTKTAPPPPLPVDPDSPEEPPLPQDPEPIAPPPAF
jgi:hypothetical protein